MHDPLGLLLDRENVSTCRGALCRFYIVGCLYKVLVSALCLGQGLSPAHVCASRTGLPAMGCPRFTAPEHTALPGLGKESVIRAKFGLLQTAFTWD